MKAYQKTYLRMHNYNPDSALKEGKDLVHTSSDFWDVQDAACHVIGMTTHCLSINRSHIHAIDGYIVRCHVIITWKPHGISDRHNRIQKRHIIKPHAEATQCTPDPFPSRGQGLGTRLSKILTVVFVLTNIP